jgi:AcrR family transcriptional regulator
VKKGESTRMSILTHATALARTVGVEGLTIGRLAEELELSKSGLFAHFGSKEALQVAVIEHARDEFIAEVMAPAFKAPRGVPRLRALFDGWKAWEHKPGGCFFVATTAELDDRPGPARDAIAGVMRDWLDALATSVRLAIEEKQFRKDVDPHQVAFELHGLMLGAHAVGRLLEDAKVDARLRRAFEALIERSSP